jgi:hypothetical protein
MTSLPDIKPPTVLDKAMLDRCVSVLRDLQATNESLRGYLSDQEIDDLVTGCEMSIIEMIDDFLAD